MTLLCACNGTDLPLDAGPDLQADHGSEPGYYLRGATLITGTDQPPQGGLAVTVRGRRIIAVEPEQAATPPGLERLDLDGLTLLPGLIDSHVHVLFAQHRWLALAELLKNGVTTVQDVGGPLGEILELREELARNPLNGPRLVVAGPLLTAPEGHPIATLYVGEAELIRTGTRALVDPEPARRAVRDLARAGVDLIKVVVTDCSTFVFIKQRPCQRMARSTLAAICQQARAEGLRVVAHTDSSADVREAVNAGVNAVTHGVTFGRLDPDLPALLAKQGVAYVPTIEAAAAYTDTAIEAHLARLGPLLSAGVPIVASTDAPNPGTVWGGTLHVELLRLVQAGLTPEGALAAATREAAAQMGLEQEIGTIAAGKRADMVAVRGNPLSDITALSNVRLVVHDGVIVHKSTGY